MTLHSGRTVRLRLSQNTRELFGRFQDYVTSHGESYSRVRIPVSDPDTIVDACTLVRYELARIIGERTDGTLEVELTAAGERAQRDVFAGAQEVTVTTRPETPIPASAVDPWAHGMWEHAGAERAARSRRGTETPAHTQRYQLTETDISILERFVVVPARSLTVCCYSVLLDQAATIQLLLNLRRLGLVNVIEVSGSHHVFAMTETGHHIRELARRNPGSPVFVAEPGAVDFKFTEEEAKPTPPQSATQPQRRLRNSRKKG